MSWAWVDDAVAEWLSTATPTPAKAPRISSATRALPATAMLERLVRIDYPFDGAATTVSALVSG